MALTWFSEHIKGVERSGFPAAAPTDTPSSRRDEDEYTSLTTR